MFRELHELALASPLMLTIVAEGEQLRVTVMPQLDASKTVKASPHPLCILATPEELDNDFAAALGIYAPGARSVLEQASIAASANAGTKSGALPAPDDSTKGSKRGRPRTQKPDGPAPDSAENKAGGTADNAGGSEDDAAGPSAGNPPAPAPESISPPPPAAPAAEIAREESPSDTAPAAEIDPRQIGLELPI